MSGIPPRPTEPAPPRYTIDRHLDSADAAETVRGDIRRGLTAQPKTLPSKYFYDATGSALFERITAQPEYYLTRAEQAIIARVGEEIVADLRPADLMELGPGSPDKVLRLLDAPGGSTHVRRYIPFDVDGQVVETAAASLTESRPWLEAHGVVGDFERHFERLPPRIGRRLVAFFGSTIGNLDPGPRRDFLARIGRLLAPEDRLLMGVDLVKDTAVLEAAYNDASGVTAAFNRNILHVVNRAVRGDFDPEAFGHRAHYNQADSRVEMRLVARSHQTVELQDLGVTVHLSTGETIWTESSHKFTRGSAEEMLAGAGMAIERWDTDPDGLFALVLARPA
jgi:L-histidine N-alpha-methyltransferase